MAEVGARARLIASGSVALVVVLAVWLIVVSPERSTASNLLSQISTERQTLAAAQTQLASARTARIGYRADVHALQVLLDAIPTSDQVPQLIDLINALETGHVIGWKQTAFSPGSAGGFTSLNISFTFDAGYVNLQRFIAAIDQFNQSDGSNLVSTGRLATVNSLSLSTGTQGRETASVTMTVYEQPTSGASGAAGTTTTAGAEG